MPPRGGPTSLPSCHWPPHSVGGPRRLVLRPVPRQMRVLSIPPFFLVPHPPQNGGEVLPHKGPPHLWGGSSCVEGGPPLWGGQLPFPLATGPPIVWGGHGAWCYGQCRGKCECFPSHPFFLVPHPPQNGGECCHTKAPPPLGGGQLRGGWPRRGGQAYIWRMQRQNATDLFGSLEGGHAQRKKKEKVIRMSFDFLFSI